MQQQKSIRDIVDKQLTIQAIADQNGVEMDVIRVWNARYNQLPHYGHLVQQENYPELMNRKYEESFRYVVEVYQAKKEFMKIQ